jgi:hypothetical protein
VSTPQSQGNKRGRKITCRRCKGKGEWGYNHLNGDTHCYLCQGSGLMTVYTAAERQAMEREARWHSDAYTAGYQLHLTVRRHARKAAEARAGYVYTRGTDTPAACRESAARTARAAAYWVSEGLEALS